MRVVRGVVVAVFTGLVWAAGSGTVGGFEPVDGLAQGPFAVGFSLSHALDRSRTFGERYGPDGERLGVESARPVQLAIWYPADERHGKPPMTMADYFTTTATEMDFSPADAGRIAAAEKVYRDYMIGHVGAGYSEDLWKRTRAQRVQAKQNARPAPGRFPLILYAPGSPGVSFENFRLCEYLASHGYVVVGIPTTGDRTKADRMSLKAIEAQTRDLEFALAEMSTDRRVDPRRVGVVGFSRGGLSNVPFATRNGIVGALAVWDGAVTMAQYLQLFENSPDYNPRRLRVPALFIIGARQNPADVDLKFVRAAKYAPVTVLRTSKLPHSQFRSLANALNVYARADLAPETVRDYRLAYEACCRHTRWLFDASLKGVSASRALLDRSPDIDDAPSGLFTVERNRPLRALPVEEDFVQWVREQGPAPVAAVVRSAREADPEAVLFAEDLISALGREYLDAGQHDSATLVFRMAVAAYPRSAACHVGLAEALARSGDTDGAAASYAEALRLDPGNKAARAGLEKKRAKVPRRP